MQQATQKAISAVTRQHPFGRTQEPDGPELFAVMGLVPAQCALREAGGLLSTCEALAVDLGCEGAGAKVDALWQLIRLARALVDSVELNGVDQAHALADMETAHGCQ